MISKTTFSLTTALAFFIVMLTTTAAARPFLALSKQNIFAPFDTIPVDDPKPEDKVFEAVEEEAYFPGKEEGWRKFLEQNLNPTTPVDNGAPAGTYTVYIQFIVDLDGKLSGIKPLTKHGYGMEAEVMRILRRSPPWVPAVQHGNPVKAYRKRPVTFQIIEEKKKKKRKN